MSILLKLFCTLFICFSANAQYLSGSLRIEVIDNESKPLAKADVSILKDNQKILSAATDQKGTVIFAGVAAGSYRLEIKAEGFESFTLESLDVRPGEVTLASIQLLRQLTETITVKAEAEGLLEQASAPTAQFTTQVLKTIPAQSREFDQALPMVPNVVRGPDGKLSIKGSRENQSALLVNGTDSTDPATGSPALSIPLESIDSVSVYTNPYLPEYGKFIGGVTKVETKRGGERWKFELNDFFPEPRIRNGRLFGFANVSPRLHIEGPLLREKVYLSQGLEYGIDKKPVRGLAAPNNEIRKEFGRSFTQLDYIVGLRQTLTATLNLALRRTNNYGLDFFNPQQAAPNQRTSDIVAAIIHRYTTEGGGLIETTFQYKRLGSRIFGDGNAPMKILPSGRDGNYYRSEKRLTDRLQLKMTGTLSAIQVGGTHSIKCGVDFNFLQNRGRSFNRPVEILRSDGTLAELIEFANPGVLRAVNVEASGFAQDQWLLRPNLSLDYGIRVETQRAIEGINLMPRFSVSFSPLRNTVLRASYGIFYDRVPLNALFFRKLPRQIVTRFVGQKPVFGPREFIYDFANRSNGRANDGSSFDAARNQTFSLELNRQFSEQLLLKVAYLDSRTRNDLYVSPLVDNNNAKILLYNDGRLNYRSLEFTARVKMSDLRDLSLSYIYSRTRGEQNDFNTYFGDFQDPVIRPNLYSNLPSDAPHRLLVRGNFNKLPLGISISPIFDMHTGFPYSVRDENQDFITRNADSTRYPRFVSLDMAITKEVKFKKYTGQFTVSIFNVTGHFNPRNVRMNIADPFFGTFFANYRRFYRLDFALIK
ncbi:MAG: TonB-dependent receptor [Acidobacteriota bacterium]|nr:TonB-dependent receptor [Blastocatellia bacterium]MDW8413292.1 TonB-dependent receptor [Acidobacteriota bacterium]